MSTEWQRAYRPQRQANWDDIARTIHDTVTMEDALAMYCPETPIRNHRCPCPIHHGRDYNFSFLTHGYTCFVCGSSGDVVTFVKEVCELSTRVDALKRINADFRLNLTDCNISAETQVQIARRRAAAQEREARRKAWEDEYHRLWDEWIRLDKARRNAVPMSDKHAEAVKNIDYISYLIDCLESKVSRNRIPDNSGNEGDNTA